MTIKITGNACIKAGGKDITEIVKDLVDIDYILEGEGVKMGTPSEVVENAQEDNDE